MLWWMERGLALFGEGHYCVGAFLFGLGLSAYWHRQSVREARAMAELVAQLRGMQGPSGASSRPDSIEPPAEDDA